MPFTDKGVTLVADVEPSPRSVLADSDRTLQVLTNLLGNALRYTDRGGTVHVRAGPPMAKWRSLLPIPVLALRQRTCRASSNASIELINRAAAPWTIANDAPHPLNAPFTLERFGEGRVIDEKGAGPYPWAH